jgi:catechol 2,3-dioxygenase-like lactoylglutathione lyase family enzyme
VKASFEHIGLNVSGPATMSFYKDMLGFLEFSVVAEGEGWAGLSDGELSIWLTPAQVRQDEYNRDAVGLNHLGLHLGSVAAVDQFAAEFLKPHGVTPILDSPRILPGSESRPGVYYQVLFTDPDGQLIEVFHSE